MSLKLFLNKFSQKEKIFFAVTTIIFILSFIVNSTIRIQENSILVPMAGGFYREGVVGQPIAINPIASPNPADEDLSALIFSPLLDLASTIDTKKDGRVYSVKIPDNLTWSNGQALTADDIVFTVKTIQNPNSKSPLYEDWEGIAVERLSKLQVQFTLPTTYAFFSDNLRRLPIIPKHIFGNIPPENFRLSAYNLQPVGSGPYRFESFTKRRDGFISQYHLVVNEKYNKEKPLIKNFYLTFFETNDDMLRAFKFRQIDGFGSVAPLPATFKIAPSQISFVPMARYYAIFFNQSMNPILKEAGLRTALSDSIDIQKIINSALGVTDAKPISGPIFSFESEKIKLSKPEISGLINQIKKKYGKLSFNIIVPKIPFLEKTANLIKDDWLHVGVDEVNLIILPLDEILTNVIKTNNYELLLFGNVFENPEDIFPFWHSSKINYPGLNLALYKNLKADRLIEKIRSEANPQDRAELLKDLNGTIAKDNPAAFLFSLPYVYVHTERLKSTDNNRDFISIPSDRFENVTKWHVLTARILKKKAASTSTVPEKN